MMERLKDLRLHAYRKFVLSAAVTEDLEDIRLAILYHDHGDDYLFIETYGGEKFEYGFWCNLKYHTNYEDLLPVEDDPKKIFIRNPFMFVNSMDEDASLSNKLFHNMSSNLAKGWSSFGFDYKPYSKHDAQHRFDSVLKAFEEAWQSKTFYDYSDREERIKHFLENSEIDTPDNLEKLSNAHFSSKLNGVDGVAGKKAADVNYLSGDEVKFAIVNGKEFNVSDLVYTTSDPDEYGFCTYYLPLDQFDDDAKEQYAKSINDSVSKIHAILDAVNAKKLTLQQLVDIDDALGEALWSMPDEDDWEAE